MMNKDLIYVIEQIGREKGISKEVLFEALESALLSASKKTMGAADNVRMEIDRRTGTLRVFARKKVVTAVTDPKLEIGLAEGRKLNGEAQLDDELEIELAPQEFGRIAAQTAKQVILQRVRDAERDAVYAEFIDREGKIVRGTVHRIEKRNVVVELGKAEAVITEREQLPGDRYNPGDRLRAYMLEVKKTAKGPQILLSRTHPGFLVRLFETEIPEIAEGIVLVKAAAREPGERAKVAVSSTKRDVDPIGACVGLRGRASRSSVGSCGARRSTSWSGRPIRRCSWRARCRPPRCRRSRFRARGGRGRGRAADGAGDRPGQPALARDRQEGQNARLPRSSPVSGWTSRARARSRRSGAATRKSGRRAGRASATCPASARNWLTVW